MLAHSQGTTSGTIQGTVTDGQGETIPGANVVAIHRPTGSRYGAATQTNGRYNLRNVRVGGPYTVEVTFVGYNAQKKEVAAINLGETKDIDFQLQEGQLTLEEITVTAGGLFDSERTGNSTSISEEDIDNAPSVGRTLADFSRQTPTAYVVNGDDDGPAISIAGQNNRYNSIYIDGTVSNDVFGLSAQGTNGGQTGATPISIDAIEEFQINISPYDVSQGGFTGGAINAITRSGSNKVTGSAYFFRRSQALAGKTPSAIQQFRPDDTSARQLPSFTNNTYGLRFGGPIVEDKLFFFVSGEVLRSETPRPFAGNYSGTAGVSGLEDIRQFMIDEVGYDPGVFGDKNSSLDSDKVLAKMDWNISQNHKLSARYNFSGSNNTDAFDSDAQSINYGSTSEVFPNDTHSASVELSSSFGNRFANSLNMGFTDVTDDRGVQGPQFPAIDIQDGDGRIFLGNERFSTANLLEQQIFTVTNDFNIFAGDHTITIGTHNEFYDLANLFIPFNFGDYNFTDQNDNGTALDEFRQTIRAVNDPNIEPANSFVLRSFSLVGDLNRVGDNSENIGTFNAYQLGLYVQDEWQILDNLRLSGGIRFDVPKITTEPRFAPDVFDEGSTLDQVSDVYALNGAQPGETPSARVYISPRAGFNWDVFSDGNTQIRGGAGSFLGRVPFVWPGGMFLNNGANTGMIARFGQNPFRPDPSNGLTQADFGGDVNNLIPSGRLEIFEDDFKYPRIFRTSLGVDQRFGDGFIATLEGQYSNTLDNINITNINLRPQNETLDGSDNRPIRAYGFDDDDISSQASLIDGRYGNIHRVGNTDKGYSYNVTASLEKRFSETFFAKATYTYGDSYAVNDGTSSQLNSIWNGVENVNGSNDLDLTRSDFSTGSRFILNLNYRKAFFGNLATSISVFWEGVSGRPFSYVIGSSDLMLGENGDPVGLFYVPEQASDLTFSGTAQEQAAQAAALEEYISSSDYLSDRRGQYAERNGSRSPFESVIDLKIKQELFGNAFGRTQKLEVTLDIFNFSNMLGEAFGFDWGQRYSVGSQIQPVRFQGFQDPENGDFTPTYSENLPGNVTTEGGFFDRDIQDFSNYSSRWQMQLGVRYTF
jgi:outer membrane receptor for ferrienterochelin and colicin